RFFLLDRNSVQFNFTIGDNKIKTERRKGYEYPDDEYNGAITEGFLSLSIIYTSFYTEPF
ncbi:hypothetical protein ACIA4K_08505, partial [Lactobacillus delbrueckii subsp. bulgaricus]|uniref:hypothetical protein n=1 Tax=Lactobacillus delbrueckii TaxID=1584 RepID=UPI0038545432